ncbi:hypothetical protein BTJ40_06475 [Microbulbifer sp. A4B17]|uniref:intermembrane phospholipid transport protein YdbH family protein n=1 Tax=Microbulbifer sp. A4B17 TaxID=359370 RepID=UPI000D52C0F2|nr:YdbH domain-containing protein [Microbulbifer sp. A4B17]AWF80486.1 hypothetical protein BTJ40_06475 [Microbulbifer sp. A4B17]
MSKLRITIITLACFLVFLITASWWKKDIVASQLINIFSGEVVIQELTGLRLGIKEVSIKEVRLKSSIDSDILLEGVKIVYPFHIIYDRDNTQKIELSIEKLTRSMQVGDSTIEAVTYKHPPVKNVTNNKILSLSSISQNLIRFLPGKVLVKEMAFDSLLTGGPLNIVRNDVNIHAETPFRHPQLGKLKLSLKAELGSSEIKISPRILSKTSKNLSEANITIIRKDADTWTLNSRVISNLETISPLVEIIKPHVNNPAKLTASGHLEATGSINLPDNLLLKSNYQDFKLQLSGSGLKASIPYSPISSTIETYLSTKSPIEIGAKSLLPFKPQYIKGNGELDISLRIDETTETPLIKMDFYSSTSATAPKLETEGTFYLSGANTVLNSPLYLRQFPALPLDITEGEVAFKGELQLSSLSNIADPEINNFKLELIPGKTVILDISIPTSNKNLPLSTTGLRQSRLQANIEDNIFIIGDLSIPGHRDIKITRGAITAKVDSTNSNSSLLMAADDIQCYLSGITTCNFELETRVPKLVDQVKKLTITNLHSTAKIQIESSHVNHKLKLENIKVSAEKTNATEVKISNLEVKVPTVNCKITGLIICTSPKIDSQLGKITSEQFSLSGQLNLIENSVKIKNGEIDLESNFEALELEVETPENYSVNSSAKGTLSLQNNKITSRSQIVAGTIKIDLSGHYNLLKSSGEVQISIPDIAFDSNHTLSDTIKGLPINIVSGKLTAGGSLSLPTQPGDTIHVNMADIAVIFKDSFATGITGDLKVENTAGHWVTPNLIPLSIESVNAGLPMENIQLSLQLDKQQDITLHNFSADFLQGKVTSPALVWNLDKKTRKSTVNAQDISLEALAQETGSGNFEASGFIDLSIPLVIGAEGITVESGQLQGEAPGGHLRYYGAFSPQMLASNPQLKLIANALEDYEFRTFKGSINYLASGDLQLQLKLVGRSEAIDSERDLIINLNLENNIPDMLRSLQASRDLTETLEKQLDQ